LLLKWINHHLTNGGNGDATVAVSNFEQDLKNPRVFDQLLNQLTGADSTAVSGDADDLAIAARVLEKANKLGVVTQLEPVDLISENPYAAEIFAAQVFNTTTGLTLPIVVTVETRAFTAYVNSALEGNNNVSCCLPIDLESNDLYGVASNGRILAALLNDVAAGAVDVGSFSADRSREQKIDSIQAVLNAITSQFGSRFITADISAANVVDGRCVHD
jgi:hypothetical protein